MTITELVEKIGMSQTYSIKIIDAYNKWVTEGNATLENARTLITQPEIFNEPEKTIMLLLFIAVEERNHGLWSRFPEDIFVQSMLVFTRSVDFAKEALGYETYTKGSWPLLYASAKWFRLGELEFELNEDNGVKEVHIHIPSGAKLTKESLYETFRTENAFMKKYFPTWAQLSHTCESWMMSPVLKEFLPANSNILYFQSLFVFKSYNPTLRWVLEFVFKLEEIQHKDIDLHTLREDTSLQRRMKKFILDGGNPGEAKAVFNEKELGLDFSR